MPVAAVTSGPPQLVHALNQEVGHALQVTAALGVHIVDLASGETIYAYNADEPRMIASNSKLFTTAAALDTLGAGYLFETRFVLRGAVHDGVLDGDLGVSGGGDPHISGRDFGRRFATAPSAPGRRRSVSAECARCRATSGWRTACSSRCRIHPDWPRDQLTRWYEAPVDALSFNDNCIMVRVSPGRERRAWRRWS